jgi:hypothetical protein
VNTYYKRKKHASGDGEGKYSKYSDVWMTPTDIAHKIVDHFNMLTGLLQIHLTV